MKNPFSSRSGKIASAVLAAVVVGGASLGVASAASAHGNGSHAPKVPHATHTPKPKPTHTPRVVALKFEELQDVTISGVTTIGSTLTVNAGIYNSVADSVTYQWQRSGVNIPDATGTTYVVTADDAGKQIRVVETLVKTGFKTEVEHSNRLWIPVVG